MTLRPATFCECISKFVKVPGSVAELPCVNFWFSAGSCLTFLPNDKLVTEKRFSMAAPQSLVTVTLVKLPATDALPAERTGNVIAEPVQPIVLQLRDKQCNECAVELCTYK